MHTLPYLGSVAVLYEAAGYGFVQNVINYGVLYHFVNERGRLYKPFLWFVYREYLKFQWDYADGWILKADVHHFFASIDHNILKEKLRRKVADDRIFALMCTYIDSTDGLPLGYQTSQLLALMYLDEFDHWVKETLHARYYGRYMDDFYIIHEERVRPTLSSIPRSFPG